MLQTAIPLTACSALMPCALLLFLEKLPLIRTWVPCHMCCGCAQTSNPSHWEGDFRLCEAMASGALILVDQMFVPRPYPLVHDQHVVVYDNSNKTDLFDKLDHYRRDRELARRVALTGYLHAMRYHRAANLMDYVFRTVRPSTFSLTVPFITSSASVVGFLTLTLHSIFGLFIFY